MHPLLQFFSLSLGKYIQTIIGSYFSTVQKDTALGKVQVVMYTVLNYTCWSFYHSSLPFFLHKMHLDRFLLLASMMPVTEDGRWSICQSSWPDTKLLLSMEALKWIYITAEDLPNDDPDILPDLVSVSFPLCILYPVLWEIFGVHNFYGWLNPRKFTGNVINDE